MLEPPDLEYEKIIACLRDNFGVVASSIEFLPIGRDSYAWVYKVRADDGEAYFLKVRDGLVYEPSIAIPRFLKNEGIEQVLACVPTLSGELWARLDDFSLILYPYIDGDNGMNIGLTYDQWIEFGTVLKRIHTMKLPSAIEKHLRKENFIPNPKWAGIVKRLNAGIEYSNDKCPYEKELAAFWNEKRSEIIKIVNRAEELGRALQSRSFDFMLCHADIHTANIMIDTAGKMFVIDWDEAVMAPKERDLMFVLGGVGRTTASKTRENELFFKGYGGQDVDFLAYAYYRYEWVIQDLGAYAERVFFADDAGDITKEHSVKSIKGKFSKGNAVDLAYATEQALSDLV